MRLCGGPSGSGSWLMASFGISGVKPLDRTTRGLDELGENVRRVWPILKYNSGMFMKTK
jgi:hypothetical protein